MKKKLSYQIVTLLNNSIRFIRDNRVVCYLCYVRVRTSYTSSSGENKLSRQCSCYMWTSRACVPVWPTYMDDMLSSFFFSSVALSVKYNTIIIDFDTHMCAERNLHIMQHALNISMSSCEHCGKKCIALWSQRQPSVSYFW